MTTLFSVVALMGWLGAFSFLSLFLFHPSTRETRKSPSGRIFWLFIVADSTVMLLIYTSGILNLFLREWPLKDPFRIFLSLLAFCVIWWRVALFWGMNMRARKESTASKGEVSADE